MYYDSKSSFYIREYGPKVLIILLIVVIAGTGLYIYMANRSSTPNIDVANTITNEVVTSNPSTESNILSDDLKQLQPLERKTVKIASVEDNGILTVIDGEYKFKAKLIGLDFTDFEPDTLYTMGQDIVNRQVEIAFDNVKSDNEVAYIYIYKDNNLYNATLLENGKVKLNSNDQNKLLLKDLTESQAFAKQTKAGVWEY